MKFIAEFKTLSMQISLSIVDLIQKLKEKMSKEYLTYMFYIIDTNNNTPSTYNIICNMELNINKALNEFDNNLA